LKLIKPNALAPMSLVPERANAVSAFLITWGLMSFPAVYFPRRWKRAMTALLPGLLRSSLIKSKVAGKANLGYIN
jgi:hypothetical protein